MFIFLKTMTSLWLIAAIFFSQWLVQAKGQTRLYLQNVPLQDEKLLVINLVLANVIDLYGAEIQLSYDPTQLQVRDDNSRLEGVQITPGPLLALDNRFVVKNTADAESGLITFAFTLLRPAPPISGEGVLATIVFEIKGTGPFSIAIIEAQMSSSQLEPIPVITQDLHLNGALEPVTAPPQPIASPAPDWRWWGTAVLLSFLTVLVLLFFLRLKWATLPTSIHPSPRRMPRATRSSTRSSALLSQQGRQALKQGDIQRAYELFSQAVELDPANAGAWLGKGVVAQQETEKRICFERVLAIDPDNATAQSEIQRLEKR
jgi:hypothetical protein